MQGFFYGGWGEGKGARKLDSTSWGSELFGQKSET